MLFSKKKRRIHEILIVEDEPLVAFDNEHFLGEEGFEIVATVDKVADALALIRKGMPIDLVLVDLSLSDGNGMEVAREASARGLLVLFVTGSCPQGASDIAHGCLAKPYPQRSLLAAIDAIEAVAEGKGAPKKLPAGFSLFQQAA